MDFLLCGYEPILPLKTPSSLGSLVLLSTLMGGVEVTQLSQSALSLYVKGHVV